jgi:putative aldouronate transport system permease protein
MLYSTTRTIDVYVYNALMNNNDYAMSSAASVYQSLVGCITLLAANAVIRKIQPDSAMF